MFNKEKKAAGVIAAYKEVFSTPQGRAVLHDLMRVHSVLHGTIEKDPYLTYYREGARSVVLRIISQLNVDEKELLKRIDEMREEYD